MLAIATFMFLFGPRLQLLDLHTAATVALAGVGVYALVSRSKRSVMSYVLIAQMPAFAYACVASLRVGGADLTTSWIALKWILYLLAGFALVDAYKKYGGKDWDLLVLKHTLIAGIVNALFVLAVVMSAPIRNLASLVLVLDQKGHWIEEGFRGFDLSMGGGASGSIVFAVLFVAFVRGATRGALLPVPGLCASILLIGTGLTGRTGLVIAAAGALLVALQSMLAGPRGWRGASTLVGMSLLTVGAGLFVGFSEDPTALHFRDVVVPWALEGLLSDSGGATGNSSVNTIIEHMLFLPPSDVDLVVGTGNAGRSEMLRYIPSDVGYVRMIFSVGLIGLCLFAVGYVPAGIIAWRLRGANPLAFGVLFYLVIMVITNFKELHLAPRGGAAVLALWSAALALAYDARASGRATASVPSALDRSDAMTPLEGADHARA